MNNTNSISIQVPWASTRTNSVSTYQSDVNKKSENNEGINKCKCTSKCQKCYQSCKKLQKYKYFNPFYYRNNIAFFGFLLAYIIFQVVILVIQINYYKRKNYAVIVARAAGILIAFNMCLLVLLVMRRLTTWLRNTKIGQTCLPLDDFLDIHKFIGVFLLVLSVVHTLGHLVNLYLLSHEYHSTHTQTINSTYNITVLRHSFVELLFTSKSKIGWFYASAMPTGWVLLILMGILGVFSLPFFRKKGYFELFYFTHLLYIPIYIVTILHTTNFWKMILAPAVFVLFEILLRFILVKSTYYGATYIKSVNLLPSKVTQLVISRPRNFRYKPGDYIFINIPAIARHEWHPFTISSAPELENEIWLHIRSLGNWTNKLYEHFRDHSKHDRKSIAKEKRTLKNLFGLLKDSKPPDVTMDGFSIILDGTDRRDSDKSIETKYEMPTSVTKEKSSVIKFDRLVSNKIKDVWYRIHLDGPYGTASRRAFQTEHAVLIASGIGVTPFASILQSLWFRYSECLRTCPKCSHEWYDQFKDRKLKKIDFIWVNRDYKSFEWFIELLAQLELQQAQSRVGRFINIRLYITSNSDSNCNETPTEIATQNCYHEKLAKLLTNIKVGRPSLDQVFSEITAEKKGEVKVTFCGANQFGKIVKKKCHKYNFKFSREYF